MRVLALFGAIGAFILFLCFLTVGIRADITIQQAIMSGLMLATCLICLSFIEK